MKALTLHQPWAHLIALHRKRIETRSWVPPESLVGRHIAIHAGKTLDRDACQDLNVAPSACVRGAVVAVALLVRVLRVDRVHLNGPAWCRDVYAGTGVSVFPDPYGDFSEGRILWSLADVEALQPPVDCRGAQGLWEWERGIS